MKNTLLFCVLRNIVSLNDNNKNFFKTFKRSQIIFNLLINKTALVYNGKRFIPIVLEFNKMGLKLGDFSPTRVIAVHRTKDKRINKNKKNKR